MNKNLAMGLGALTGAVSLVAMLRLISGAFNGGLSAFAWVFLLLAMVPWIGYAAWRARHGRLTPAAALTVLGLCGVGLVAVWWFTAGAVTALAASLAAFGVIWVHDWPDPRPVGESRFVRIDELVTDDGEQDRAEDPPAERYEPEAA